MRDGKINAIMTEFSAHSVIVVLDGFKKLEALKTFLTSLTAYKGLRVYYTSLADEVKAAH